MKIAIRLFWLGCLMAFLVYLMEHTTDNINWLLVFSFPICWGIGGYLFSRWNIGAYHKES